MRVRQELMTKEMQQQYNGFEKMDCSLFHVLGRTEVCFVGSRPSASVVTMTLMCGWVGLVLSSWLELCDPRFWSQEGNPGGTVTLTTGISPKVALSNYFRTHLTNHDLPMVLEDWEV